MKDIFIALTATLFSFSTFSSDAGDRLGEGDLHMVVATVGQILEQAQYSRHKLDPSMGKQILEIYLENLDVNKLFFTQEDIDQIRNAYGSTLDEDILLGNLTPAKSIFAIFRRRVDERVPKIEELLNERYEFNSDRTIIANREKERWPANALEADGIWKDRIENELLAARLQPSESESASVNIGRHYRELQSQIDEQHDVGVMRIFLEAVAQTYDPHSEYLDPSDWNQFKIDTRLTISGIGAEIHMKDGHAIIDRIFVRGPADRSGKLHVGDQIIGVAQGQGPFVDVEHSNLDQITEMILGESGSTVRLRYISSRLPNPSQPRVLSLVRKEIRLTEDRTQAKLVEMAGPGGRQKLGWITVPSFYGEPDNPVGGTSVTRDVAILLGRLAREGIQGLVVDLRNNGGGSVTEAVKMTALFVDQGPIVQLKDPNNEIHVVKEQAGKALYQGPMVVLDNKLTASASEIFSAAMQDYKRAAIVGDSSTFGKGSVQAVIELNRFVEKIGDLPDLAGALKITIEKIYRVTGESTQIKGVISDLKIPSLTEAAVSDENEQEHRLAFDTVAPAAREVLRNNKPLFLEELRSKSDARIQGDSLFQDLIAEIKWEDESLEKNRDSLNEKVRKRELAEIAQMRDKVNSDREAARAQDRRKYYKLTLAGGDKIELTRISSGTEIDSSEQISESDDPSQSFPEVPSSAFGRNFDTVTESEAITRETLNILSDLVNLTGSRQLAAGHSDTPALVIDRLPPASTHLAAPQN